VNDQNNCLRFGNMNFVAPAVTARKVSAEKRRL